MLKLISVSLLFLFLAAPASADSFTATFTCASVITCGSTPSSATATFGQTGDNGLVGVTWDTVGWEFSFPADWQPTDSYEWVAFKDTTASGATDFLTFRIEDLTIDATGIVSVEGISLCPTQQLCDATAIDFGVLSFSPVAAPEPSAVLLLGIGALTVALSRRRIAHA